MSGLASVGLMLSSLVAISHSGYEAGVAAVGFLVETVSAGRHVTQRNGDTLGRQAELGRPRDGTQRKNPQGLEVG